MSEEYTSSYPLDEDEEEELKEDLKKITAAIANIQSFKTVEYQTETPVKITRKEVVKE